MFWSPENHMKKFLITLPSHLKPVALSRRSLLWKQILATGPMWITVGNGTYFVDKTFVPTLADYCSLCCEYTSSVLTNVISIGKVASACGERWSSNGYHLPESAHLVALDENTVSVPFVWACCENFWIVHFRLREMNLVKVWQCSAEDEWAFGLYCGYVSGFRDIPFRMPKKSRNKFHIQDCGPANLE